jgi:DNA/RNA-binding domain of Phe-tRNA-synthetase-like protein
MFLPITIDLYSISSLSTSLPVNAEAVAAYVWDLREYHPVAQRGDTEASTAT